MAFGTMPVTGTIQLPNTSSWYQDFGDGLSNTLHGISNKLQQVIGGVNNAVVFLFSSIKFINNDVNKFEQCCTKLGSYVIVMIEQLSNAPNYFSKLKRVLGATADNLNLVMLIGSIDYFFNARFQGQDKLTIAAMTTLAVVNVGGALMWLQQMGFCTLSTIAAAIGEVRVFSFVPAIVSNIPFLSNYTSLQAFAVRLGEARIFSCITSISIGTFVSKTLMLCYGFLAVEAFTRLFTQGETTVYKTAAGLDAIHYVAEVVFGGLVLSSAVGTIGLGITGGGCLFLTLTAFIYNITHSEELKRAPTKEPNPKAVEELINIGAV